MKGFTLIEVLIYSALIAMIISGSLIAVYQIIEGSDSIQNKIIMEQEANFLISKIRWALTGATTIISPTIGASSSTLSINKANYSENPIVFDLNLNNLRIKQGSGNPAILNNQNIAINNLIFEHLTASGSGPEGLKISLTVNNKLFTTIIYLRK
ncbi:MAG: prepilin-type N-terminal cleavage/methylation domain-containing protein [Patescibacteria group bacterium]